LGAALLIGSGAFDSHPASLAQRATSLETQIRCPSCEDVSVADSEASAAIAVRHQVTAEMRAGWSDQRIEAALVARYGPTILLRPPSSGLAALVWVLPAVAAAGALVWMGALFWRRSRQLAELRASGPDDLEDR
jgi:cytochrome c-type biogenesis protein CcmH